MKRATEILCGAICLVAVLYLVATLTCCTASQRGWWHDNVPVIGSFFDPFVPPPAVPLWHVALNWIANFFVNHPVEASAATAGVAAIAKHAHSGIPGTKRNEVKREQRRRNREAKKKLDLMAAHKTAVTA